MPRARIAASRHRVLVAIAVCYLVGFLAYGLVTGADLTIPYVLLVAAGGYFLCRAEPPEGFSGIVLAGMTLWGFGHLLGGLVGIGDDRTVYNAVLGGHLHADNIVHFIGFGTAGLVWYEATRPWLRADAGHELGIWAAVWLAGMGVGALNEVVEFFVTLVNPDSNVGGYHNTGRDLVANMLGAAVAGLIAVRRTRESAALG
jgi:hypothetical protein